MTTDANAAKRPLTRVPAHYAPVAFKDVPGWETDQQGAAFGAFLKSCERLIALSRTDSKMKADPALIEVCVRAGQLGGSRDAAEARAFFETYFVPHRVVQSGKGLLTAYYEPIVPGSRTQTARFSWPLYKRPSDLVTVVDEANRGAVQAGKLTHARQTANGLVPYATRAEIEQGALKGQNLELVYVEHAVDAFFMQIQGSARVKLQDGSTIRVGYDGKNGHPYTSIGRVLIDKGEIPVERMSLQALSGWLKANAAKAREVMWANKSFVFFKEHAKSEASGPEGVHNITLTPGRSLAVDPSFHALGAPVFVAAPEIKHIPPSIGAAPSSSLRKSAASARNAPPGFHRLMIAQDVGSAIKGPERGDIYVGTGDLAGKIAGITKHPGHFYVLVPKGQIGARTTVSASAAPAAPQASPPATAPHPAAKSEALAPVTPAKAAAAPKAAAPVKSEKGVAPSSSPAATSPGPATAKAVAPPVASQASASSPDKGAGAPSPAEVRSTPKAASKPSDTDAPSAVDPSRMSLQ